MARRRCIQKARGATNELSLVYTAMLYLSSLWWGVDTIRVGTCTFPDGVGAALKPPITTQEEVVMFFSGPFIFFAFYFVKIYASSDTNKKNIEQESWTTNI